MCILSLFGIRITLIQFNLVSWNNLISHLILALQAHQTNKNTKRFHLGKAQTIFKNSYSKYFTSKHIFSSVLESLFSHYLTNILPPPTATGSYNSTVFLTVFKSHSTLWARIIAYCSSKRYPFLCHQADDKSLWFISLIVPFLFMLYLPNSLAYVSLR